MKPIRVVSGLALLLVTGAGFAAEAPPFMPAADAAGSWDFTPDPRLPNVLIHGDSISIAYTRAVRAELRGRAHVFRPMNSRAPDNRGDTRVGLRKIDAWLGTQPKWDVIHFNWGLWDLCYRNPQSKTQGNRAKVGGTLSVASPDYARNLEQLVTRLKATGAILIWASTTVVPENEAGRFVGDDAKYNGVAARVMQTHGLPIDDLFAVTKGFAGKFSLKAGDVHFTSEGYQRIAVQVAAAISGELASHR